MNGLSITRLSVHDIELLVIKMCYSTMHTTQPVSILFLGRQQPGGFRKNFDCVFYIQVVQSCAANAHVPVTCCRRNGRLSRLCACVFVQKTTHTRALVKNEPRYTRILWHQTQWRTKGTDNQLLHLHITQALGRSYLVGDWSVILSALPECWMRVDLTSRNLPKRTKECVKT
jgi:hypothetical protein